MAATRAYNITTYISAPLRALFPITHGRPLTLPLSHTQIKFLKMIVENGAQFYENYFIQKVMSLYGLPKSEEKLREVVRVSEMECVIESVCEDERGNERESRIPGRRS